MSVTEIAHLAGVSQATVSKVINEYPSVSQENMRRVREAMDKLNYHPAPRRRKSPLKYGLVAVLALYKPDERDINTNFSLQLNSIAKALRQHGCDLMWARVSDPEDLPNFVRNRKVDGLILVGHQPSEAVLSQINVIPSVWLTSHHEATGEVMLAGNEDVGRLAADYLAGRGHKHLGIVNVMGSNPALDMRFRYFTFIAEQHGCRVSRFESGQPMPQQANVAKEFALIESRMEQQIKRLLAQESRPTGLFIPYDQQVAIVYRVLHRLGIPIDEKLQIIGDTDEKPVLAGLYPRPATINTAPQVMGRHAVEQLMLRLRDGDTDRQVRVVVEPKLVSGDERPTEKP
ncbi:MAG: LacI family DNA-binding transcriptional regulator [Phycisphaeraceae bacterium]|nr:LacI family DNA-binding transcriptional regulator [Phycisphaeraceae bacterium]